MRANIRDIMKLTGCNQELAIRVEQRINELFLIDWSRDSYVKIKKQANLVLEEIQNNA